VPKIAEESGCLEVDVLIEEELHDATLTWISSASARSMA
jgi:hypothetical protein